MKNTLIALACGLALAFTATTAQALTIGDADPRYLGEVDPGTPSSEPAEAGYINQLISMGINTTATVGTNFFDRSDNPCNVAPLLCPAADPTDFASGGGANVTSTVVTGWEWLYVKYGGEAHVWYVGGLSGSQSFSGVDTDGSGVSHFTLFNGTPTTVPDGGATLGLLGLGMLGLRYLRRRQR